MGAIHRYEIVQTVRTKVRSTSPENALDALLTVQTMSLNTEAPQIHDIVEAPRVADVSINEEY